MELLNKYFSAFSNKDLSALESMFDNNITLEDWNINVQGKDDVLEASYNIFNNVRVITIEPVNFYGPERDKKNSGEKYAVEIRISVEGFGGHTETLDVVDVFSK